MRTVQDVLDAAGRPRRRKPAVGDTALVKGCWRRWDGRRWTLAAYALRPQLLRSPEGYRGSPEVEPDRRTRLLEQVASDRVTSYAATVVLATPTTLVLGYRRHVSHLAHALLTLVTGGVWGVVWLAMFLGAREERTRYEIDRWGNVWAQQVASRPS